MSRGGPLVARLSATSRSNDLNVLLRDANAAMTHAAFSRKQGFSQASREREGHASGREGLTLLVCRVAHGVAWGPSPLVAADEDASASILQKAFSLPSLSFCETW